MGGEKGLVAVASTGSYLFWPSGAMLVEEAAHARLVWDIRLRSGCSTVEQKHVRRQRLLGNAHAKKPSVISDPGRTRTYNPRLRGPMPYPLGHRTT